MTDEDEKRGFWKGQIEANQKNLERRMARVEGLLWAAISLLASLGASALGILPW